MDKPTGSDLQKQILRMQSVIIALQKQRNDALDAAASAQAQMEDIRAAAIAEVNALKATIDSNPVKTDG